MYMQQGTGDECPRGVAREHIRRSQCFEKGFFARHQLGPPARWFSIMINDSVPAGSVVGEEGFG